MKLLHRTSLSYLLFSALLMLGAGFLIFALLTGFLGEEITEKLEVNKNRLVEQIAAGKPLVQLPPVIEVEEWTGKPKEGIEVRDRYLYDPIEEEEELFRELSAFEKINGNTYHLVLRQVIPEPHDYWSSIGLALGLVMLALLLGLLLINWHISRRIWNPFYRNLAALKHFSLESEEGVELQKSNIHEFQELNAALATLSEKIRSDYHTLREFTENASHEMQTPLAVLHAQIESALQVPGLTEKQALHLNSALNAAHRLGKLNQTLLLLAKIENRQFRQAQELPLQPYLKEALEGLEPLLGAKNISFVTQYDANPILKADPALLEMLLSNLLSNAIRHNLENGHIDVHLDALSLRISNTGPALNVDPEKLFARFAKGDPTSSSQGLGLAIVQKICLTCGWKLSYEIENNLHILKVGF